MSPGTMDNAAWNLLPGLGLLVCLLESALGLRASWRWTWTALLAALFLAAIAPACLDGPDPATAVGDWLDLLALLALAGYLVQVLPGRERFCTAALAAGLATQLCLAVVQRYHILPLLQDPDRLRATLPGVDEHTFADVRERVARGGIYTTFRIANGLAMYLAMVGILLGGVLWRARRGPRLPAAGVLILVTLAGAAYALTGAKGAAVAAVAALAWVLLAHFGPWPRWILRGAGVAGLLYLVFRPPEMVAPSVAVRAGYARAAWGLVGESPWTGHGWNAFAAIGGRHLPLGAEFSKHVHNAWLEVAVSAGVPLALLLVALMLTWMRPSAGPRMAWDQVEERPGRRHLVLLCAIPLILGYLTCFGTLVSDNLAWWTDRGDQLGIVVLLGLAVGVPATLAALVAYRLPGPPRAAGLAAAGAFSLGCLVDFHFAEPALLGTAVICVCLVTDSERPLRNGRTTGTVLLVLAVAYLVLQLAWLQRLLQRQEIVQHQSLLQVAQDPAVPEARRLACRAVLARAYGGAGPGALRETLLLAAYAEAETFPCDTALLCRTAAGDPDPHRALAHLSAAADGGRVNGTLLARTADAAWRARRYGEAVRWARERVALHPNHMGFRWDLVQLLRRVIPLERDPEQAAQMLDLLEATVAFMAEHFEGAHFRVKRGIPQDWFDLATAPLQASSPSR